MEKSFTNGLILVIIGAIFGAFFNTIFSTDFSGIFNRDNENRIELTTTLINFAILIPAFISGIYLLVTIFRKKSYSKLIKSIDRRLKMIEQERDAFESRYIQASHPDVRKRLLNEINRLDDEKNKLIDELIKIKKNLLD